jgi:hypothetical protein
MGFSRCLLAVPFLFSAFAAIPAEPVDHSRTRGVEWADDAATLAGIGKLRTHPLARGEREIRIWISGNAWRPGEMLRLRIQPSGEVQGGSFQFANKERYQGLSSLSSSEAQQSVLAGCAALKKGVTADLCIVSFRQEPRWRHLYQKLTALGLLTLPDESTLPNGDVVVLTHVGETLYVEIREGADYRAYSYKNPQLRREPEAAAADNIVDAVFEFLDTEDGT